MISGPAPPRIVVLGGINIDLVAMTPRFPAAGETVVGHQFLTYGGGKGANQAVAAGRMGAQVSMVGRVGDDIFAPQALKALVDSGVDVSPVGITPATSTGIAVITIDDSAQNQIIQVLGANDTCGEEEEARVVALLDGASTLLLQLEVSVELSLRCAQAAKERGVRVILDPSPVRPVPAAFYSCCDIITPNETDAHALVGAPVTDRASAARGSGNSSGERRGRRHCHPGAAGRLLRHGQHHRRRVCTCFSSERGGLGGRRRCL